MEYETPPNEADPGNIDSLAAKVKQLKKEIVSHVKMQRQLVANNAALCDLLSKHESPDAYRSPVSSVMSSAHAWCETIISYTAADEDTRKGLQLQYYRDQDAYIEAREDHPELMQSPDDE